MKKIYIPMIRFGDKEFDEGFIGWGFAGYEDQIKDAQRIMKLVRGKDMEILDVGCGIGTYHKVWLEEGHSVTGIDLSATFIYIAESSNSSIGKSSYRVEDYYDLNEEDKYDLVTMIDTPVEDGDLAQNVFRALKPGGHFVFHVANPRYNHARGPLLVNHRDWREEEDGTFTLTRHEYNEDIDRWEYEEWIINPDKGEIVVQHNFSSNLSPERMVDLLLPVGFATVSFYDYDGRPYNLPRKEEPKNFFAVAYKGFDK